MTCKRFLKTLALCGCWIGAGRPAFAQLGADLGQSDKAPAAPATPAMKEPTIKLLDAGTGAKKELRYAFVKGSSETLVMEMNTSMKMSANGQQIQAMDLPGMRMTMKIDTTDVLPNGDAKVNVEFADADVVEKPGLPPQVTAQMRGASQALKGMKGTATLTPRGQARDAKFDVPADANPQVKQSVQQAQQQMSQVSAPLPAEAVGQGAKWESSTTIESNGIKINQIASYTLKELTADGAVLDMTIKQTAAPQAVQGGAVTLESMETNGGGTTQLQFNKSVPTDAALKMNMAMVMAQGPNQKINMDMKMDMTMKPAEKK